MFKVKVTIDSLTRVVLLYTFYTFLASCHYNLYGPHGHFSSPNYPQNYGHNLQCAWHITTSAGDGTSIYSSLSEKTRISNHFLML